MSEEVRKDLQFIWHPFTHLKYAETPVNIVASEGAYYFDENGRSYIDAISSWWVNLHGHSHPYIAEKIFAQMKQNAHSIFSGFTHPQAIELSERLVKILPGNIAKIFFSDDGSTAVEVGIKMALQYFHNRGEKKTKILALENAYHGDTFGAMSAGARNVFTSAFSELLFDVVTVPVPYSGNKERCIEILRKEVAENKTAAFIFEPLVQGAGGMVMYDADVLDELIGLCKKNGVICIGDEVMTGFGRTGKMFASDYLINKPDIVCLSKGLTGGFMPLGVTACSSFVYDAFLTNDKTKTFFHGHSYTANPTACAAANASLDLLLRDETWKNIFRIESAHKDFMQKLSGSRKLKDVRCLGTIIAFELKSEKELGYLHPAAEKISFFFLEKGIVMRPLGNIFYILPPYCIKEKDLNYIYCQVEEFLKEI